MHTECLSNDRIKIMVADTGALTVSNAVQQVLSIKLLPFDRGMEQPFPYDKLKETPLFPPCEGSDSENQPAQFGHSLDRQGDVVVVSKTVGSWRLSQNISIKNDACVITSYIHKPEHQELPRSLNVIALQTDDLREDASIFVVDDRMASFRIDDADSFSDGDMSKMLFAIQKDQAAILINSEVGSANTLCMGKFGDSWHGLVSLPKVTKSYPLSLGTIEIRVGTCAQQMLEEFASGTMPSRKMKPSPVCWNSWDYYHTAISHDKILQNIRAIAADDVLRDKIDTIVVDMGWEVRFGEWVGDPNFPEGMAGICNEIRNHGFRAGLWFAPMIVHQDCNFFQEDYNWVAKNSYGFPDRVYDCCGLVGYALDITRREGEDYLRNLFRSYREMGYTYFKLDFLRFVMYAHQYHDLSKTNVEVMRRALEIVREGAGDDAYILGCNMPFEVGPGYCDACRMSDDVSIFWDSVKANARAICSSYFFNGKWWTNDPDFLVVRGRDTFDDDSPIFSTFWFPRQDEFGALSDAFARQHSFESTLTYQEARTHASLELISGGARVIADPLMHLNDKGKELIYKVLSAEVSPGYPVDLFAEKGLSTVWLQHLSDRTRVGLFNWDDNEKTVGLDWSRLGINPTGYRAIDFWTGDDVLIGYPTGSFTLDQHSSMIIEIFSQRFV